MSTQTSTRVVRAIATREGQWWTIALPDLETVTQARHVREIDPMAHDLAALWLDVDAASVTIDLTIEIPEDARAAWEAAKAKDAESKEIAKQGGDLARQAIKLLRARHQQQRRRRSAPHQQAARQPAHTLLSPRAALNAGGPEHHARGLLRCGSR
ncbi:hypothetical protein [Rathayibacter tanaceti]|nr:hypothetical protein [Rathayibacter tanaceti]QHC54320.1 hypothetical protein GSU10_00685 [Rathayibacter tanaceti]